jgi:hypothetical protein
VADARQPTVVAAAVATAAVATGIALRRGIGAR